MTPNARRRYSRQFQHMLNEIELRHIKSIYRALRKQVLSYTEVLRNQGEPAARFYISVHLINPHLEVPVKSLYRTAGLVQARKVRGELRLEQQKRFGYNDELVDAILDYLNQHLLDKLVRPVSQTTRDWVLRMISKGVQDGLGAREIAKSIEDSPFLRYQALRIVRTETVRASNIGAVKVAETSPFEVQKEWIAAHDNRTRHSHRRIDGQVRDMEQTFGNGLLQPGDPNGPAKEVIACRCTLAITAKRDENGNLIIKKPSIPITDRRAVFI